MVQLSLGKWAIPWYLLGWSTSLTLLIGSGWIPVWNPSVFHLNFKAGGTIVQLLEDKSQCSEKSEREIEGETHLEKWESMSVRKGVMGREGQPHPMMSFWFLVLIFHEFETQLLLDSEMFGDSHIFPFLFQLGFITFFYWLPSCPKCLGWGCLYFKKTICIKEVCIRGGPWLRNRGPPGSAEQGMSARGLLLFASHSDPRCQSPILSRLPSSCL